MSEKKAKVIVILLVVAAGVLLVLSVRYTFRDRSAGPSELGERPDYCQLVCTECGHVEEHVAYGSPLGAQVQAGGGPVVCPACGARSMVLAIKCRHDGTFYPTIDPATGSLGRCPTCGQGPQDDINRSLGR